AARQAGAPPGRDPGRLHGLHDPRPVRGRLRTRLRRALSQPAVGGSAQAGGVFRSPRRMTMHRRPLGRGRTLAAVGGALMVVGCILPWWKVGGTPGIPPISGDGMAGTGILVFLVGIATIALVALPYAAGDRPVGLDRWLSFAILAVVGWIGFWGGGGGGGAEGAAPFC